MKPSFTPAKNGKKEHMLLRLLPGMLVAALLALLFGTVNPPSKPPESVAPERREPDLSERARAARGL